MSALNFLNNLKKAKRIPLTSSDMEATLSGATIDYTNSYLIYYGKVCQLHIIFTNSNSIAGGSNLLTATMTNSKFIPIQEACGAGYYGERAIIGGFKTTGQLIIRNSSSVALSMGGTSWCGVCFTFLIN